MKNKKGFTLIEVLAVIIILAVILVIIAPKVNEYYKDSVKRKNLQSARGVRNALNQYFASVSGTFMGYTCEFPDNCSAITLDGSIPTGGIVTITADGIISGYVRYDNNAFILNDEGVIAVESSIVPGDFVDFSYSTSGEQTYSIPDNGYYKLEVWGAQGGTVGSKKGGYGGYSSGIIYLSENDVLYINVGGKGCGSANTTICGGYNGGGSAVTTSSSDSAGGGGGATHIALSSGTLVSFDANSNGVADSNEIGDILIVAGGGGGAYYHSSYNSDGGAGGGYLGGLAPTGTCSGRTLVTGSAASQSGGGTANTCSGSGGSGTFGKGGSSSSWSAGGGGGYYGGGSSYAHGANGGSGYIGYSGLSNGVMYCYGCYENGNSGTKTVSTTGSNGTASCSNGYSSDPLSNCAKSENGHDRITYIGSSL